ncbi:translation initiation factor IF-2 subunit alpha [Methanosalsum natronophilum]|uniref:Translation initiation factor 2 subunit alpha n=1 Tax=Methanosalsum natronophilum TaxID=768733 RepID=A0A3R7VUM6_9EURY|nr:translation initiation factor IF-2 subunit alpha [Methanosalsum natronophilum]MCS3923111.1 translation initiation factor 2 subunit 1 [Methanosalsum natronophilum]RQD88376.1 MAG: translation initiation factor IF-2 subunit alpha [Methanosalsum natronophilum]
MEDQSRWPEVGELVVCTVKNVTDFGAYTTLEEYEDKEGFIHISEIKAGWVKYVRDHVREGQKIVCKVLNVDPSRRHIDMSLKDVNEHQRREKIQEWKNEQKATKWLQFAAEETKTNEKAIVDVQNQFYDQFGSAYSAFEEAAINGSNAFKDLKIGEELQESIVKIATENIKLPFVNITGYVDLTSSLPNGIEIIKDSLRAASEVEEEGVRLDISYTGAPRYRIKVIAPDYKIAETVLKRASNAAVDHIHELGGKGQFHRHIDTAAKV